MQTATKIVLSGARGQKLSNMPFYCVRLSIAYRHIKREQFSLKAKFMN